MADVDNLDGLSNAEIRAQMIAQGLPNIPVTDSSRKVLVKRLRASLGGNASPVSSPKKTSNRRETMQPAAAAAPSVDKRDGANANAASKARRTIAVPPSDTKEAERRRKPETVAPLSRLPEPTQTTAIPKVAVPIQSRRISNSDRRGLIAERPINTPETIVERETTTAAVAPKQRSPQNVLEVNSLIVLESDDEEDEQLAQAAQHAENQYKHTQKPAMAKLTTTTTNTQQYVSSKPAYRAPEPVKEPLVRRNPVYERPSASQATTTSQMRSTLGGYDYSTANRTDRYSTHVTAPIYPTLPGATYRRSPPRTYANEFSDDTAEDEDPAETKSTKFESEFARKLASLRAERIGDNRRSVGRTGTGTATGHEPVARRSLRQENVSVSTAFGRLWQSLDYKYNLKPKLFILFVLFIFYCVYKFYY